MSSNPLRAESAAKRRKHVDEVSQVVSILVDLSTSSLHMGEIETDPEEVTATTTDIVVTTSDTVSATMLR